MMLLKFVLFILYMWSVLFIIFCNVFNLFMFVIVEIIIKISIKIKGNLFFMKISFINFIKVVDFFSFFVLCFVII